MDLAPPKGTLDLLPPDGSRMRALYDLAAATARLYGYRYVETPDFESTDLVHRTSGETSDVVTKETNRFTDVGAVRSRCGRRGRRPSSGPIWPGCTTSPR